MNAKLWRAENAFRGYAGGAELPPGRAAYGNEADKAMRGLMEYYFENEVLIPPSVCEGVDKLLPALVGAGLVMEQALDPMTPNGETRAGFWKKAQEIVFRDVPAIRKTVKAETREILDGRA